jgi:hypothetical protein
VDETFIEDLTMAISFTGYVDEPGGEGFTFKPGCSDWLVLSAVVVRTANDSGHDATSGAASPSRISTALIVGGLEAARNPEPPRYALSIAPAF